MTATFSHHPRLARLLGPVVLGLGLLGLAACNETGGPNLGATASGDPIPQVDFGARGPIPKGSYGTVTGESTARPEVFAGSPLPASATAFAAPSASQPVAAAGGDGRVRTADADGDIVPSAGGFQLNFENADVGAVAKAVLGDILKSNYLVDKRVSGQITLTSAQPVPRSRLVPLLETALAGLGATVVKDQDLYRVVPSADMGGIAPVGGRDVGEGYGTSVITARFMPAANLAHLLEGFGGKPGSIKSDAGTNLVIIQGTASERRAAIDAANLVDVDWLRSKSVAILPVSNSAPDTMIGELNHILDSGEGGMAQGAIQLQPMSRLNAVLAVARTNQGLELVRRWVARLDRADSGAAGVKVYKLQYAQAKAVATALNELFGNGGGSGGGLSGSDGGTVEPSTAAPTTQASPALTGMGAGRSAGGAQQGGPASPGLGDPSSPFGVLKAAMTDQAGAARAAVADTDALRSGGGGGSKVRVTSDPTTNSLLINAGPADYKLIERAIHQMDREPVQVDIEATIAEVTLTDQLQFGVQFFLQGNRTLGLSGATNATLPTSVSSAATSLLAGGLSNPKALLSALQGYTSVKILSSPSLVVLDRQPAVLQVGDQVPILTRTAQSVTDSTAPVVNNVDYKDTGVILNVLPKVNANGVVTLDVEQQISAVASSDPTSLTPTISQRRVRSSVSVANGQTVMLAGLISDRRSNDRSGIPGLGQIQFLNDLLTSHDSAVNRTEIIIFIRPRIITSAQDAQDATEEFHNRLELMQRAPEKPVVRRY